VENEEIVRRENETRYDVKVWSGVER